jgi:hypothetical protein
MARMLAALVVGLLCCSLSTALNTFGPFGGAPANTASCPATCKVRGISVYGTGMITVAANADACISKCMAAKKTYYSYSAMTTLCGCGSCTHGYAALGGNYEVVSGRLSSCVKFPSCSSTLTATKARPLCACPVGSSCTKLSATTYQCCCQSNFPIVQGGSLVGCTSTGA